MICMTKDAVLKDIAECYSIVTAIQSKIGDLRFKLDIMEQEVLCDYDDDEEEEDDYYELTPRGEFMMDLINKGLKYDDAMAIADKIDWGDK